MTTGHLTLAELPTQNWHAVPRIYVDNSDAAITNWATDYVLSVMTNGETVVYISTNELTIVSNNFYFSGDLILKNGQIWGLSEPMSNDNAATKLYVDIRNTNLENQIISATNALATINSNINSNFLKLSGGTLSGALSAPEINVSGKIKSAHTLSSDSSNVLTTKKYVDNSLANAIGDNYVSKSKSSSQKMVGPLEIDANVADNQTVIQKYTFPTRGITKATAEINSSDELSSRLVSATWESTAPKLGYGTLTLTAKASGSQGNRIKYSCRSKENIFPVGLGNKNKVSGQLAGGTSSTPIVRQLKWQETGLTFDTPITVNNKIKSAQTSSADSSDTITTKSYVDSVSSPISTENPDDFSFGEYGNGNGQFNYPVGVAVDSAGNIYVADKKNDRVQKFDRFGKFVSKLDNNGQFMLLILARMTAL